MQTESETRGCDGRHGISTALPLSDGWILHCCSDGERLIGGGREDATTTGGIEGRGEQGASLQRGKEDRISGNVKAGTEREVSLQDGQKVTRSC